MRIAVFLASSPGTPAHRELVTALASSLAGHGHTLVYGGARVGLMGLLADTALAAGNVAHARADGAVTVAADDAGGVTLVFGE